MKVLFLGCHCDDIELGCGGTINKHKDWDITCVCFSSCGPFGKLKNLKKQSKNALNLLGVEKTKYLNYKTNNFWIHRQKIWEELKKIELQLCPDLVFTHSADEHQDHTILFQETIRNFKNKNILCYKPSLVYGTNHYWNWIEPISKINLNLKIKASEFFKNYIDKNYFNSDVIKSQARITGLNSGFEFAEGFQVYRIVNL